MESERVKRTRVPARFEITVCLRRKKVAIETLDISLTGIRCTADPLLQENSPCRVTIALGPKEKIEIGATILRAGPEEAAIAFSSMNEKSFFHLKRMLQLNADDADLIEAELRKPAF